MLPRWHGAALGLVEEQHLRMAGLGAAERQHGAILFAPATRIGVPSLELRQVVNGSGLVEHRYIPTLTVATSLAPQLEMRNRIRVELRDIAGTWSQRYQERLTLIETLAVRRQELQPSRVE